MLTNIKVRNIYGINNVYYLRDMGDLITIFMAFSETLS